MPSGGCRANQPEQSFLECIIFGHVLLPDRLPRPCWDVLRSFDLRYWSFPAIPAILYTAEAQSIQPVSNGFSSSRNLFMSTIPRLHFRKCENANQSVDETLLIYDELQSSVSSETD
jgi:hypothetical protein